MTICKNTSCTSLEIKWLMPTPVQDNPHVWLKDINFSHRHRSRQDWQYRTRNSRFIWITCVLSNMMAAIVETLEVSCSLDVSDTECNIIPFPEWESNKQKRFIVSSRQFAQESARTSSAICADHFYTI